MECIQYYNFMRDLLFGNIRFKFKPTSDILMNQLLIDVRRYIDIEETIRQGGLFYHKLHIISDLDTIITYIDRGNKYLLDSKEIKNDKSIEFKSTLIREFFYKLSSVCRGNLDVGVISNNYAKQSLPLPEKVDEETLQHIINNDNDVYLVFKNAHFWGTVAKNVIQQQKIYTLSSVQIPIKYFKSIEHVYDIKCQSLGKIVDPFSFILTHYESYVDPIHWESVEALKMFVEHFPENNLSRSVKEFVNLIIYAILTANDDLLPKNILDNELQIRKFIKNMENIDNRIEKVVSNHMPVKVIDVFHRLLALVKYDYMWDSINISEVESSKPSNILINMYLKNTKLERENKLLRQHLMNIENKFHSNINMKI